MTERGRPGRRRGALGSRGGGFFAGTNEWNCVCFPGVSGVFAVSDDAVGDSGGVVKFGVGGAELDSEESASEGEGEREPDCCESAVTFLSLICFRRRTFNRASRSSGFARV